MCHTLIWPNCASETSLMSSGELPQMCYMSVAQCTHAFACNSQLCRRQVTTLWLSLELLQQQPLQDNILI